MKAPLALYAKLTHDCGAKLEVAFEDVEQPYTCPGCGIVAKIESDTLADLMTDFGRALLEADRRREEVAASLHGVDGVRVLSVRLDCHTGTFSEELTDG